MMDNNVKTAMVGTPCQILAATKINEYSDKTGGSSIDVKIGLFCMENFSYTYLKEFLIDKKIDINDVKGFRIEENKFKVILNNNDVFMVPLSETDSFKRKKIVISVLIILPIYLIFL